ncbi:hypothetical protein DRW48_07380 [Paracoccus suum]|uniref:DUF2489 domain-containing protein n=1 Tax=Paracoccus suum TaxID=2259340 RepID=A0A344PJH8_9RHOB|nr:hypothetical protein [Paracoccus suum]AXC49533.1 hypothetical protein DRW48_07380 [Paracoccus suum]
MMHWSADVWSAVASWIMAVASVGACVVGLFGLWTWKKQDMWKADKDLARRMLLTLSHYENAVRAAVNMPATADPSTDRRAVAQARAEVLPLSQEAEAVWGKDFPADRLAQALRLEGEIFATSADSPDHALGASPTHSGILDLLHRELQHIEAVLRGKLGTRR